jgi:hypothetical protein
MAKAKEYPAYNKGDLVKVSFHGYGYYWMHDDESPADDAYGLIVGRTQSWYEAYEQTRDDPNNDGTRYWDNVNYSPYRVMMCDTGQFEWVSPENLELVS